MLVGLLLVGGGAAAGVFGSLLGLGGGVLIVPLLTLGFGLPLREAVGISLICVIVTSSAAARVFLQRHVANLRLGMSLELFTAIGALVGGLIAFSLSDQVLAGLFAVLLTYVAITMARRRDPPRPATSPAPTTTTATGLATSTAQPTSTVPPPPTPTPASPEPPPRSNVERALDRLSGSDYRVRRLPIGVVGSLFAGVVSALLGVGGGIIKVPLMNLAMGVPLRVATATSNLMIGVTASASAILYLLRGEIDPYVSAPTAVGVFIGATLGSRIAHRVDLRILRLLFVVVLLYTAFQMALRAIG